MNSLQDIVALLLATAALAYVGRFIWRTMAGRHSCGCGHGRPCRPAGDAAQHGRTIVRRPIITVDQVNITQTGVSKNQP